MALTREFKETIRVRVREYRSFRDPLLREGVERMLSGDVGSGKAVLRDYIRAAVGFEQLGAATGASSKRVTAQPQ